MISDCEFCVEINAPESARFAGIYDGVLNSRIVASTSRFVAMPTLGQLFEGSLLILPKRHVETFADLGDAEKREALQLIQEMTEKLEHFGHPFLYEHGARCQTGGGCGIYHAHVHIVPLPLPTRSRDLVDQRLVDRGNWLQAWESCKGRSEYLAVQGNSENVSLVDLEDRREPLASQYCRRQMARLFDLRNSWDWRTYGHTENKLIATVAALGE